MAINKAMRIALKALSYPDFDIKKNYKLHRQIKTVASPYLKPRYTIWDHKIAGTDREIPVRIFLPKEVPEDEPNRVLIFFHGGGWVTGNIDSYSNVCDNMANQTASLVVSVDYRLAPEYPFPCGLEDCYRVTREIYLDTSLFDVERDNISIIGDSAGANLSAAVSLMARDRGEFKVSQQILIYPSTNNDHSDETGFPSIRENGKDYLLTSKRIRDYMDLYISSDKDLDNPYLAPLISNDLSNQPRTLIITAEYDPLRDEGEAYAKKLYKNGNTVELHRMKDALHGFIALPKNFAHVKRSYEIINKFLRNES
ncbi:MAG: alpha/beta hydrolase [Clostridiales bacterium]|jgi:acetyl esterase/lipase|nr:alpha/beta hydrolase [Clostridiales bacterium]